MYPTNINEQGCSPISSNCVIWQGPDIACINLCKGDTVSTVVAKLATELCNVLDTLDIDSYDLACFNITSCPPEDFQALIQFLIEHICALENITPPTPGGNSGCPDCVVNIASCFYYLNPQGDTITTMQLLDYVTAIGNRICSMANQIITIQSTLIQFDTRITDLESSLGVVTKKTNANTQQEVTPVCVLPPTPVSQRDLLIALEAKFCELMASTGEANDIYTNILKQCAGLSSAPQLAGSGNMASIPGWETAVTNMAGSFGNMWLAICDIRSAILNIQANCCPTLCDSIQIAISAALNGPTDLRLYFTGVIPPNFVECNPTGTLVKIEDTTGGSVTIQVPVITNLNNGLGYSVDLSATPVNTADDLTITATFCFNDPATGTQCQSVGVYILANLSTCPVFLLIPTASSVSYSFNWIGGAANFEIQLYDSSGTVLIASQSTSTGGVGTINGIFNGLTVSTTFKVRLKVTIGANETLCPFNAVTTLDPPCLPPSVVGAIII